MTEEQVQHIQKILDLRAEIAKMSVDLNRIGAEYTSKYCPFTKGEKVLVDGSPAIINSIIFDPDSYIEGRARIQVRYYESLWSEPVKMGTLVESITDRKRIRKTIP